MLNPCVPECAAGRRSAELDRVLCVRLTGFVSFLRENGFGTAVEDAALLVDAVSRIGLLDPLVLRWSARALLCRQAEDRHRFDELFDSWFHPPNRRKLIESRSGRSAVSGLRHHSTSNGADASEGTPLKTDDADSADASGHEGSTAQRGASADELLAEADFRHLHEPAQVYALDRLMRHFARRLPSIMLRKEYGGGARRVDLPGTARRSVSHGGDPIELAFRRRRQVRPRIVLLLDVSRSMNLYSFFFLRLARALQAVHLDTHVFIWHTRLSGVSEALRDSDPWRAQERLQMLSAGWAGGTRIGECLEQFERGHRATVHSRTALIVVSDGYDTGEPQLLSTVLSRLRKRARRVIWLNPLAGRQDYTPSARGMQAALPHIDLLAPAHNLACLERVLPQVLLALR